MNRRERLLSALACEIPDRVPISTYELVGYNSKAFENNEPSYTRLMDVIREKTDCICMWNPATNVTFLKTSYPVEQHVEHHREEDRTVTKIVIQTPKGPLSYTNKTLDNVYTTWATERWCKSSEDVDRALSVPYEPVQYNDLDYPRIQEEVGDNGIIMASLGDALCVAAELMEMGAYTVWAMTETEHFARTIDALHEQIMENLRRMLDVNVVDLYRICGPEYATPPYLPPEFFARFVVPQNRDMVDLIHSKGGKVRLHSHGRIGKVLDMILETGADGTDPCEGPPDGDIGLADIKKRLGRKMSIFGNLQLKLLELGSEADVENVVKDCMAAAKEGGGYVIMPTAAPINVPLAEKTERNYIRFIDTALEYGQY